MAIVAAGCTAAHSHQASAGSRGRIVEVHSVALRWRGVQLLVDGRLDCAGSTQLISSPIESRSWLGRGCRRPDTCSPHEIRSSLPRRH
jgi:hypothetical protein